MEPRISLITLGVQDLPRAVRFYRDGLGWSQSSVGGEEVAFFQTGGVILALWPREELAADARVPLEASGFRGFALAHNVANKEAVDRVLQEAMAAGGTVVRPAEDAVWGGYTGYFADPDGFLWEVAWTPGFPLRPDGSVQLPE